MRLDLVAALESSLAGQLGIDMSYAGTPIHALDFVLGLSPPTCVLAEPQYATVNLGTIQPQQSTSFTMWIVLPDVITPDDPQPSEQTLEHEGWFIDVPALALNGTAMREQHRAGLTGSRVASGVDPV
ncbi:MAG: hypothetical protein ACYDHN_14160 [Solirubrobacteraceae bacterium]